MVNGIEGEDEAGGQKIGSRGLRAELQARIAEAEWLKTHYDESLRAAFAQIESLQARVRTMGTAPEQIGAPDPQLVAEVAALRAEVERLTAAENRYLDRIEELKERLASRARDAD